MSRPEAVMSRFNLGFGLDELSLLIASSGRIYILQCTYIFNHTCTQSKSWLHKAFTTPTSNPNPNPTANHILIFNACLSLIFWSSSSSPSPVHDVMLLRQVVFGLSRLLVPEIMLWIILNECPSYGWKNWKNSLPVIIIMQYTREKILHNEENAQ